MEKGIWHKKMPTLLAFAILFIGIFATSFLVKQGVNILSRATPDKKPQNITISNITDSSFVVSFATVVKTQAGIALEEPNAPASLIIDDREKKSSEEKEFNSHYITVADLASNTTYEFSILSDGETFLNNNNKFSVTTGPKIEDPPSNTKPIFGKVILPDGEKASDTIVKLTIPGGQTITSLTNKAGEYIIPTNAIRDAKLGGYLFIPKNEVLTLTVQRGDLSATIKTVFETSDYVPTITLATAYDFTKDTEEKTATFSSVLKVPSIPASSYDVKILTPSENQSFIDGRPLFKGTGVSNQIVKITIESEPITAQVKIDPNGSWTFRPQDSLPQGIHTITIETADRFGIIRTIKRTFTIFSQGSQIAESATPSASPTPTTAPVLTPTLVPTSFPTPTPIQSEPTATITIAPSPTQTVSPAPTSIIPTSIPKVSPPAPGAASETLILTLISIMLIFTGSALLFFL